MSSRRRPKLIPDTLPLKFKPAESKVPLLPAVYADPIAWLIWCCWRPSHMVSDLFNAECLAVAAKIRARNPKSPGALRRCFSARGDSEFAPADVKRVGAGVLRLLPGQKEDRRADPMTTFHDGPAHALSLMLKCAPRLLRVVHGAGRWDALDQLADEPGLDETITAYRREGGAGFLHIKAGKGGDRFTLANYRFCQPQPTDEQMRTTHRWQQWCRDNDSPHPTNGQDSAV